MTMRKRVEVGETRQNPEVHNLMPNQWKMMNLEPVENPFQHLLKNEMRN